MPKRSWSDLSRVQAWVPGYGDPGLPMRQGPPLGLTGDVQRSTSTTFGTSLAAGTAGKASN